MLLMNLLNINILKIQYPYLIVFKLRKNHTKVILTDIICVCSNTLMHRQHSRHVDMHSRDVVAILLLRELEG